MLFNSRDSFSGKGGRAEKTDSDGLVISFKCSDIFFIIIRSFALQIVRFGSILRLGRSYYYSSTQLSFSAE